MLSDKMTKVFPSASFLRRACRKHIAKARWFLLLQKAACQLSGSEKVWWYFTESHKAVDGRCFVWYECVRTGLNCFFNVPTPKFRLTTDYRNLMFWASAFASSTARRGGVANKKSIAPRAPQVCIDNLSQAHRNWKWPKSP